VFIKHLFTRKLLIGLGLASILVTVMTIIVVAQTQPGDGGETINPPVQVVQTEEEELTSDIRSTDKYMHIPASAFVPQDDDMSYNNVPGGCIYRISGTRYSQYSVQLPQGAEIDYIRLYFYDNNADFYVRAELRAFDGLGGDVLIKQVDSYGQADYYRTQGDWVSPTHIVDNYAESLVLRLYYGDAGDDSVKICGVRIHYLYGIFGTFMPLVTK